MGLLLRQLTDRNDGVRVWYANRLLRPPIVGLAMTLRTSRTVIANGVKQSVNNVRLLLRQLTDRNDVRVGVRTDCFVVPPRNDVPNSVIANGIPSLRSAHTVIAKPGGSLLVNKHSPNLN